MRRCILVAALAIGGVCGPLAPLPALFAAGGTTSTIDLKNLLEKGLKAGTQAELDFIASVLAKVESGELPESTVRATFLWARQKPVHQYQYFQFGIRERAKKLGVSL